MKGCLLVLVCILVCCADAETLTSSCMRTCGEFEQCFVYKDSEFCAEVCAPGRCNDDTEMCTLRGVVPCTTEPCLPEAVCEPRVTSMVTNSTAASSCELRCQLISSPVCGSDGASYANSCFLKKARCTTGNPDLVVASRGICEREKALNAKYNPPPSSSADDAATCLAAITCADVLGPVCTSAGTMRNLCYFNREKKCNQATLSMIRTGSCEDSNVVPLCPATCTDEYDPVCASNGQLYGNDCLFRQAKCARRDQLAVNIEPRVLSECEA
ncbi:hypothetical protein PHYSODRAFT_509381 [Phytophthora sojae]|uniref:Kazal-like domain-containing protein n=1 Tax=Phytophthora sojae (strain P6497) TaxID=1094619 RepID=G4ZMY7_PHYSP|nr:hypothetical protein PHYSODRAFT_333049 [Phytophthora sojae]XP_009528507.1 hypothetical protein PHYSODRAFT_509381 [Phytophthora sojae]EGZ14710.1 hypothetical protein PHYSODRAFT_333049 [Phytophthora sojae]EGZ14758.1 hypothetical protein PHYSODRAFT_509381 [Phytophthora sojae]|eukprot:XP_009528459.1 hypothetical protein PHYSODRAFT_333049 [Phytophthora sojae]